MGFGSPTLINQPQSEWIYCWKCGANIQPKASICPHCKAKQRRASGCLMVLATLGGIFLALIFLVLITGVEDYRPEKSTVGQSYVEPEISKEEFITQCEQHTYEELARTPNEYYGVKLELTGKVSQVQESGRYVIILLNIGTEVWDNNTVWCTYTYRDPNEPRILENDKITIYGVSNKTHTYTTVLGASKTIPAVEVKFVDINS